MERKITRPFVIERNNLRKNTTTHTLKIMDGSVVCMCVGLAIEIPLAADAAAAAILYVKMCEQNITSRCNCILKGSSEFELSRHIADHPSQNSDQKNQPHIWPQTQMCPSLTLTITLFRNSGCDVKLIFIKFTMVFQKIALYILMQYVYYKNLSFSKLCSKFVGWKCFFGI